MSNVKVLITGTGGGGYERTIEAPAPDESDFYVDLKFGVQMYSDWWEDHVFEHTGSGKGGHDYVEAKIVEAESPAILNQTHTWEG